MEGAKQFTSRRASMLRGTSGGRKLAAREELLWRAKLADKPTSSRRQVQRINPIAFQAAKRSLATSVSWHYQQHQSAAVLAPPG